MPAGPSLTVTLRYWSWFRDLAGTDREQFDLPGGSVLADLLARVHQRHPRLAAARNSTLVAVGVEYQPPTHALRDGDEVSLFPPVQGG
jgi:molybdopterin converting factor small subunit